MVIPRARFINERGEPVSTPTYHKIQSLFLRDPDTNHRTFLDDYTCSEFYFLDTLEWVGQEKLDGMNMRAVWDPETQSFTFFGRSDNAQIPNVLYKFMCDHFLPHRVPAGLRDRPFTFFGEGIGPGIQQGGGYGDVRFVGFDIRVNHEWLEQWEVELYCNEFKVEYAANVFDGDLEDAVDFVAGGFDSRHGERPAEGLVLRPPCVLLNGSGERIITKLKTKDFTNVG